jgi:hypothetical protein
MHCYDVNNTQEVEKLNVLLTVIIFRKGLKGLRHLLLFLRSYFLRVLEV